MVLVMDKTTISITPSQQALSAITCTPAADIVDKNHLRDQFRKFAGQTKCTLMNVFAGDVRYIPASPKTRMEGFVLLTPDHATKVAVVWVQAATGLVQYSFNPSQLTGEAKVEFDALLQLTLVEGYVSLYRHGTVSVAEYGVDVEDVPLKSVVLVDTGLRKYTLLDEGTTYCGVRRSELVAALYDKGDEIRRRDSGFCGTRLRYEVRRRAPKQTLEEWVTCGSEANPFAHFVPVPRSALRDLVGARRAEQIRNFGLRAVVLNGAARAAIISELHARRCEWANPELIWANFRSHLIPSLRPPELINTE